MCAGVYSCFLWYIDTKKPDLLFCKSGLWVYSLNFQKYPLYFEPFFMALHSVVRGMPLTSAASV
jgi:hypothetical protein